MRFFHRGFRQTRFTGSSRGGSRSIVASAIAVQETYGGVVGEMHASLRMAQKSSPNKSRSALITDTVLSETNVLSGRRHKTLELRVAFISSAWAPLAGWYCPPKRDAISARSVTSVYLRKQSFPQGFNFSLQETSRRVSSRRGSLGWG